MRSMNSQRGFQGNRISLLNIIRRLLMKEFPGPFCALILKRLRQVEDLLLIEGVEEFVPVDAIQCIITWVQIDRCLLIIRLEYPSFADTMAVNHL